MPKLRIWTLGNLYHGILPTKDCLESLEAKIKALDHKSDFDVVCGPGLTVREYDIGCDDVDNVDELEFALLKPQPRRELSPDLCISTEEVEDIRFCVDGISDDVANAILRDNIEYINTGINRDDVDRVQNPEA